MLARTTAKIAKPGEDRDGHGDDRGALRDDTEDPRQDARMRVGRIRSELERFRAFDDADVRGVAHDIHTNTPGPRLRDRGPECGAASHAMKRRILPVAARVSEVAPSP